MRLQNLLSLTGAELQSEPAVTQIDSFMLHPKKIRRGDLFIAYDPDQIPEAIAAGAYAILYDADIPVTDPEIAWLKTPSIDYALLRLLRFHLLEKSINAVRCDDVTLAIAAQMLRDDRCYVFNTDLKSAFHRLWDLLEQSWVFIPDSPQWDDLFVNVLPLPRQSALRADIAEQTLFETSFVLDDVYYERMQLSPFFLPYLVHLYTFAKNKGLRMTVGGMQGSSHFIPVFVAEDLRVKPFGQGGKVLVLEPDLSLLMREIAFVRHEAKWAKIIYLIPEVKLMPTQHDEVFLPYRTQEDIMHILKSVPFHFALIGGQDRHFLEILMQQNQSPTLF